MAKHKLSAMFSDMRGKLNGSKFSKGRSAHTLTNKVKGSNPQTSAQGNVRSLFRKYTSKWQTLSEEQITAWNEAANDTAYKNAFGDSYKTTGHKLFVQANVNAGLFGGTEMLDPEIVTVPTIVNIDNIDVNSVGPVVKFDTLQALDPDTSLVVTATRPLSAGKTNLKGQYRTICVIPAPTPAGTIDVTATYVAKFGNPIKDRRIGIICYTWKKVIKFKAGNDLAGKVK